VLSFDFEEPEDLTYADKDDIGRYRRVHLHLQPDAKTGLVEEIAFVMPYLPTYGKCKEEESAIIAKGPGYEVTEDGKCVTRGFDIVLERSLLLHWEAASRLDVVVVQVFGDGFQMFRCGKYVNFCLRTCGVHKLSGSAKSCETLAVWGGDDGYEETKHRVGPAFDLMEVVARTKAFNTAKGSVKCHVVSGGDYAFVSDMTGGSGAGSKFPCVYCEKPQSDLWHPPTKKYTARRRGHMRRQWPCRILIPKTACFRSSARAVGRFRRRSGRWSTIRRRAKLSSLSMLWNTLDSGTTTHRC